LNYPHIFSGNPLDRGETQRRDEEWISKTAQDPNSRFLPMWGPKVLITEHSDHSVHGLGWLTMQDLKQAGINSTVMLLGMLDGTAYYAVDLSQQETAGEQLQGLNGYYFEDARNAAEQLLTGPDAGILAQGRAQINWHNRHGFCSVCGHETDVQRGGQKRVCPACKAEHFPRVDPVIICLVTDGEQCLLGQSRGRLARMNRYSALAGFVDQGESIEEAVAREIMEEAGLQVRNVRYHSSQPWPFPSSLMMGCHAEAATTEINMDPEEMTDVKWFGRQEVLQALAGENENLLLPGPVAIAHHLIKTWANGEVS
jgi:NAD+ diphosphatase